MEVTFFSNQEAFRDWFEQPTKASELWVGYFRKSSGRASLTWSDSVDVALCYGWIDGIRKSIDDQSYKIRFTPRNIKSVWSAVNVKKVETLIPLGKMKPAGMHVFNNRSDTKGYTSEDRNIPLTSDYEAQIKANKQAWEFLSSLAPSYKRESIWWVMSAKKEETRARRLGVLISSSEAGLKIPNLRKNNNGVAAPTKS